MSNIPNTITILINTRIRGYQKIKYSPSMTEPKSTSSSVYFDPLVKLSSAIVKKLPPGFPEKEKYTQFFNKIEFNDLISRTLASTQQKKVTLTEATDAGYVDNNIDVLLKTLFAPNNRFYIQGTPFTIYGYEWTGGDWRIDTVPGSTQVYPFYSRLSTVNDPEKQLEALKKEYPLSVLNGYSTGNKYSRFGNKNVTTLKNVTTAIPVAEPVKPGEADTPVAEAVKNQIPVNTVETNIPSDPLAATLLYGIEETYKTDVQKNPKLLDQLYKNVMKKGNDLNDATNTFTETIGLKLPTVIVAKGLKQQGENGTGKQTGGAKSDNLMKKKLDNDRIANELTTLVEKYKQNVLTIDTIFENPEYKNQITVLIEQYMTSRQNFLKEFLVSMKLLYRKFNFMNDYIKTLLLFYKGLLQVKTSEIKNSDEAASFKLYLIKTLFNFDIQCYTELLNNQDLKLYRENLKIQIQTLEKKISLYVSRQYNFKDLATTYLQYPQLLSIQTIEFSIYMYNLVLLNENYESILWNSLSVKSGALLEEIRTTSFDAIKATQQVMDEFKNAYNKTERNSLTTILKQEEALKKQTPLFYESSHTKLIKNMTNAFLSIQNQILLSYDLITLFSRISIIVFAREIAFCSSKKNASMINLQMHGKSGFETYYNVIYSDSGILSTLKKEPTLFWNLSDDVPSMIAANNKILSDENAESEKIDESCGDLQKKYMENLDLLVPQISALGLRKQCLKIMGVKTDNDQTDFLTVLQSQYNVEATQLFRRQLFLTYRNGINDGILDPINQSDADLILKEWMLFGKSDNKNSLFESISLALNSGLIHSNSTTNNRYSSSGMYSPNALRDALADNITLQDVSNWTNMQVNLSQYRPDDPERIPYNFLFDGDNRFIGNDLELLKDAIRLNPSNGGKYYGDYQAIQILEKVFSVKIITLHVENIRQDKKNLLEGQRVNFSNNGQQLSGTIVGKNGGKYSIMLDDRRIVQNIDRKAILQLDNVLFRVECDDNMNRYSANDFTHYIILMETGSKEEVKNYQVAFNMKQKLGIFTLEQLEDYIYYLIFYNCFVVQRPNNNWYSLNAEFDRYMQGMKTKYDNSNALRQQRKIVSDNRKRRIQNDTVQVGGEGGQVLSVPNKNLYSSVGSRSSYGYGSYGYGSYGSSSENKLTYYIVIDLELYPGDSIPLGEKSVLACQTRYEKIRKAYAELFGIQYYPNEFLRNGVVPLKKTKLQNPYLYR